ncbi:Ig-like domain-containing protein [Furfurilactobacillus cerevisiae]|uniref:Ig-like domain-containing protein n=1 Tax=Furfurilactobacillus rossiae TaxID=231049 RepID=UPI003B9812AA
MLKGEQDKTDHYKMYKAGKRWLFACIALITFGVVSGTGYNASADDGTSSSQPVVSEKVQAQNSLAQSSAAMTTVNNLQSSGSASSLAPQDASNASNAAPSKVENSGSSTEGSTVQSQTIISSKGVSESETTSSQASSVVPTSQNSEVAVMNNAQQMTLPSSTTLTGQSSNAAQPQSSAQEQQSSKTSTLDESKADPTTNALPQLSSQSEAFDSTVVPSSATSIPITNVGYSWPSNNLGVGQSEKVTVSPTPANATYKSLTFTSDNPSVATVDNSGVITGVSEGKANIFFHLDSWSGPVPIVVYDANKILNDVNFQYNNEQIEVGQNATATVTTNPIGGIFKSISWKSDNPTIGIVDANGKFSALAVGTATVEMNVVDYTGKVWNKSQLIKVIPAGANEVTGFSVSVPKYYLEAGSQEQLTYATNPNSLWPLSTIAWASSNLTVATIDSKTGLLTAVGEGETSITATGFKYNGNGWVQYNTIHVFTPEENFKSGNVKWPSSLMTGLTVQATFIPDFPVTKVKSVTWSSSDSKIATIDEDGRITALTPGSVILKAIVQGYNGSGWEYTMPYVVGKSIPLTEIKISTAVSTLGAGEHDQLAVVVTPTNANLMGNVKWTSSDLNVVTVNENGLVTVIGPGSATITATAVDNFNTSKSASIVLTVLTPKSVTTVTTSVPNIINMGQKVQALTNIQTDHDGYENVTWQSSNTDVATVDLAGDIITLLPGTTTLTGTIKDSFGVVHTISKQITVQLNLPLAYESQRAQIDAIVLNFNKTLKSLGVNYTQLTPFAGNRWGKTTLTYSVANPTAVYHASDGDLTYKQIWEAAARNWNTGLKILGSNITLVETTDKADVPGIVEFDPSSANLGDAGVYGYNSVNNQFVSGNCKITLFGTPMTSLKYTRSEVIAVLMHEMGHALDLWHSPNYNSVMWYAAASQMIQPVDVLSAMLAAQLPGGLTSHIIGLDDYSNGVDNA